MENYVGSKCISCGETFKEGDDIVVCPECGTPYHRECYKKEGQCINYQLHESEGTWTADKDESGENGASENRRCPRCGYDNEPNKLFCEKCGMPLNEDPSSVPFNKFESEQKNNDNGNSMNDGFGGPQFNGMPFPQQMTFDKDSEIEGVKLEDYAKYVGNNPMGFLANFVRFGKFNGKVSLNLFAFLFPKVYFLYRKMNLIGIITLVVSCLIGLPSVIEYMTSGYMPIKMNLGIDITSNAFKMISNLCFYLELAVQLLSGFFANYLYYKKANKDIKEIRNNSDGDETTIKEEIANKGGTSWIGVIVGYTLACVITGVVMIVLGKTA